jgi:hypothetical protein
MRTYRPLPRFKPLGWLVAVVDPKRALVVDEPERKGAINSSWAIFFPRKRSKARGRARPAPAVKVNA